jgi:hypothetical protein
MAEKKNTPQGLSDDELDAQAAEELPQREQMSLIDPTGGSFMPVDQIHPELPGLDPPTN